ncbi:MAG: hypothetical protein LC785_10945 [Acidobacteria bacterium]|nr:hypothetical protein [Acidobacteriota bacterium]MCA1642443.1 hypothetical protein [Acidobacteriota bacterium]
MTKIACACLVAFALGSAVFAQKEMKPWTEWTKKDVVKVLNDSAWGQTQLETQESSGSSGAVTSTAAPLNRDARQPAPGSISGSIKYFVRFFSAKPIRQAIVRKVQLEQPDVAAQRAEQSKAFIELASDQYIIIAVAAEVSDKKMGGGLAQAFSKAKVESLKNVIYLQRKDGKRVFLQEYAPPGNAEIGARFVFPRKLDGQPFITPDSGEVRFHAELGPDKQSKIDCRFKIADMMYNGTLEY